MALESRSAMATRQRTESALRMFEQEYGASRSFIRVCRAIGSAHNPNNVRNALAEIDDSVSGLVERFTKAVVPGQSIDSAWDTFAGRDLADAYVASIAEQSLFDLVARYATPIPPELPRVMVASGSSADEVAEGAPIAVSRVGLALKDPTVKKCAALLVYSDELDQATGGQAARLFENELRTAVLAAFNRAVLANLVTTAASATGTAKGDLQAGLQSATSSKGYIVAATPSATRELALDADGRMAIDGGEYLPGVHVVSAVDEDSSGAGAMYVIPASRVALTDYGIAVQNARDATIAMSDSPSSPAQLTSLYQTDSRAIRVVRRYRMASAENAIKVA